MAKQQKLIRIPHPDYGYVEFHNMSVRQTEVLKTIKMITDGRIKKHTK